MKAIAYISGLIFLLISCAEVSNAPLPYLGHPRIIKGDTIRHTIPDFSFIDQDSNQISPETFKHKIYVADFFFTSCPTICPRVKKQMLRIYDKYESEPRLKILSHSIDTRRDSVPRLKLYADKLGVSAEKWHLVTGDDDLIFEINEAYMIAALKDDEAPGGFDHSGNLVLVDDNRHIRAFCDGTDPESVDNFMNDIDKLLNEVGQ